MNINATLILQIIVFVIFVWITLRYIWPPIMKVLAARQKTIADGLAAAEQGQKDLELAQHRSRELLTEAKTEAQHILEQANHRANHIIEEAKAKAREEGNRLLAMTQGEIEQAYHAARQNLISEITGFAITGAEKILHHEIDQASNDRLLDELVGEI